MLWSVAAGPWYGGNSSSLPEYPVDIDVAAEGDIIVVAAFNQFGLFFNGLLVSGGGVLEWHQNDINSGSGAPFDGISGGAPIDGNWTLAWGIAGASGPQTILIGQDSNPSSAIVMEFAYSGDSSTLQRLGSIPSDSPDGGPFPPQGGTNTGSGASGAFPSVYPAGVVESLWLGVIAMELGNASDVTVDADGYAGVPFDFYTVGLAWILDSPDEPVAPTFTGPAVAWGTGAMFLGGEPVPPTAGPGFFLFMGHPF